MEVVGGLVGGQGDDPRRHRVVGGEPPLGVTDGVERAVQRQAIEIVGHEYKFNSRIVGDKSFSAYEFSQLVGFDFKKGEIEWKE